MNSIEVLKALDVIAADKSTKFKQEQVTKHFADPLFKRVCVAAYNPFITFGVKPQRVTGRGKQEFTDATWAILKELANRRLTGNDARSVIDQAMDAMDPDSAELLWRVLNKDLRAGFGSTIINKAASGTIPEFPYMRCSLLKNPEKDLAAWDIGNGFISQRKEDGEFLNIDVETDVSLRTRQGNAIPDTEFFFMIAELKSRCTKGTQLHGEMVVFKDGKVLPRQIGNGMINAVQQGGKFEEGCKPHYVVWDQIPMTSVKAKGICETPYKTRLSGLLKQFPKDAVEYISVSESKVVKTLAEAYQHASKIQKAGGEGTVIKNREGIWKDTGSAGSPDQIKIKLEVDVELKIVGYREGEPGKKTEKTFGALICRDRDDLLEVGVSGMSDKIREKINADREGHLNGIITVRFNDIMEPSESNTLHSLFLPRMIGDVRTDKTEADTLEYIKAALNAAKEGKAATE